jgi:hypothetical protein
MTKLMRWRRDESSTENITGLQLELTIDGTNWHHYTNPLFSSYRVPELNIPRASKGITTMQNCLKHGFKFVDMKGNLV